MSSTPSIRVSQHQRYHSTPSSYSSPRPAVASPMAIPRARESVPPPLPPPAFIPEISAGQDPGWQWGNDPNGSDFGRPASVKPGSSLLGSAARSMRQESGQDTAACTPLDYARRGSSISTVTLGRDNEMVDDALVHSDEDGSSSRPPSSNYGLQSERQLEQRTLEESSQTYDKQLLSRIGGPNTPKRGSVTSASLQENGQLAPTDIERRNNSLRPLSMPERRHTSVDSPSSSRWPSSGAISPVFTGFWPEHGPSENSRTTTTRHGSLTFDDHTSHRGSYDQSMFINDEFGMEEGQMSNLNIHDRSPGSPKAGSKRRASSPPRDREERSSVSSASGQSEIYQRRSIQQLPNRGSPISRFTPNQSSVSSASSFGPRHGSLGSSLGVASVPSSATSYGSGRVSPSTLSPAVDSDLRIGTPYGAIQTSNPNVILASHQRSISESTQGGARKPSVDGVSHSRNSSLSHMQGIYMCECCPKKPRKFDTEEELRIHESEKQYTCAYCLNRFKNKNEAERHQNSLHLRRHSWSCAALSGIEAAFHASQSGNTSDVCGYCGDEFSNPPQWDIRAEHLNSVHKFGECNLAKKFFRADHFRQHLKHSHQGTSGKWTNMLENACMKDEPPPEKRTNRGAGVAPAGQAPPALMVSTTGLIGAGPGSGPDTIEEAPHES